VIAGGWLNHNWIQLGYQLADSVAGFSYSFVMTCVILFLMNLVPGLSLRASAEDEDVGLDDAQLGEFAYDYVELSRHVNDILPGEEHPTISAPGSGRHSPSEVPEKQV
jgi:Amt family ammonium transporter